MSERHYLDMTPVPPVHRRTLDSPRYEVDPEMGPCGCLVCEVSCPNVAPRDEGSPDSCDGCLSGTHAGTGP